MFPTQEAYTELQTAYDYFNRALFDEKLPSCLITLQREKRAYGYFSRERFVNSLGEKTDEIAMNPCYFAVVPAVEIMQTLVHEMTHLWQFHFGSPGRRGYHNKEWGAKMEEIGLMPSDTGKPDGKKLGEKMSDYVIEGGHFERHCVELLATNFAITWKDRFPVREQLEQVVAGGVEGVDSGELSVLGFEVNPPESKQTRRKYTCEACNVNVWGKPNLHLLCGDCHLPFVDTTLALVADEESFARS